MTIAELLEQIGNTPLSTVGEAALWLAGGFLAGLFLLCCIAILGNH